MCALRGKLGASFIPLHFPRIAASTMSTMSRDLTHCEIWTNVNKQVFVDQIYAKRQPAVLKGVDIGQCVDKWSVDYLASVGGQKPVKLHVCPTAQMDFVHKNFLYRSLPFDEFVRRASQSIQPEYFLSETEKYYLRSVGKDPRKQKADIQVDFPELAEDINLPNFIDRSCFFSSVLRISSQGTQLWTHYDVMDNLLMVVSGQKRVVLFPPSDALYLYLNGDKSEIMDIDNPDLKRFPEFAKAHHYECILGPGDVLFIPAMWFHNVINLEAGVAVNMFWRHLDSSFYDSKDTYGNKDLLQGARAMQVVDRAVKILEELPEEYRDFYARRLIDRIQQKACIQEPS